MPDSLLRLVEIHAVHLHIRLGQQAVVMGERGIKNDFFSGGKEGTFPGFVDGSMPSEDEASEIRDYYAIINKKDAFDM